MGKRESILAFLLSASGEVTSYGQLYNWLLQAGDTLEQGSEVPFDFISNGAAFFSFELDNTLSKLEKKGLISQNGVIKVEDNNALTGLSRKVDFDLQLKILAVMKNSPGEAVGPHTRVYATEDFEEANKGVIYTTGYEGKNLDSFIISLLKAGIKTLVDVRCNAVSRKFGFSKKHLSSACEKTNISYTHMPELGIPSESRQSLKSQHDYDLLFLSYQAEILPHKKKEQQLLCEMIEQSPCVLMCYEANPMQCHRTYLARTLATGSEKQIKNLR